MAKINKNKLTQEQVNKALKKGFKELDRAYLNLLGTEEQRLFGVYQKILNEVRKQISQVYENFGNKPTITELRKYNRLVSIEKAVLDKIKETNKELQKYITNLKSTQIKEAYKVTGELFNSSFKVDFFDPVIDKKQLAIYLSDNLWYDALERSNADFYVSFKRELETVLRANAREEVVSGIAEGKPYREVMKALIERFNISYNRAKTITFTEMHKAHMIGRNEATREASEILEEAGIKYRKVWRHNNIGKPREDHLEADGQVANEDGYFYVGGEELEAPGLGTDPANNINCHCTFDWEVIF